MREWSPCRGRTKGRSREVRGQFGLDDHWLWLLAAALLGILEIFLPGIFLIWVAAAAAVTGIVAALLPIALPYQLALFGLLAMAAVYAGAGTMSATPWRAATLCSTTAPPAWSATTCWW